MEQSSIYKTLSYHDIFDFPLKFSELYRFLITPKPVSVEVLRVELTQGNIGKKDRYLFLKGKQKNLVLRMQREKNSLKKLEKAKRVAKIFKFIPGIIFLGISGSLSMKNAKKDDDIDLFVITKSGEIWMTRGICILILTILGVYRNRNQKHVKDRMCLNMLIDENNLNIKTKNIYTAHEVGQVLPLFQREKGYEKFMNKNGWIKRYLANYKPFRVEEASMSLLTIPWLVLKLLRFEAIARFLQLRYMGRPGGNEVVKDGFLAFHPGNNGKEIVAKFEAKTTTRGH